jgi:hypothetical protein
MSTNYYAKVELGDRHSISTTLTMHIGKTGRGVSISGDWFRTFAEMKTFLEYNKDKVVIEDEYSVELSLDKLVEHFESFPYEKRRAQYDAVMSDYPTHSNDYWLDPEGYTFCTGYFS